MNNLMRCCYKSILLLITAIFISGCGGMGGARIAPPVQLIKSEAEAKEPGSWVVMVYMDADNNLESNGLKNINEMEKLGSTKDCRVIVQIDRNASNDSSDGNWTDTRRYLITHDEKVSSISSLRLDNIPLGEMDMSDKNTLRDFVLYCKNNFPADNYCLVIWDHGTGWEYTASTLSPKYKYILTDDSSNGGMNISELNQAIDGFGINVIAFDACYMQQIEVGYEIKDNAEIMVASAGSVPANGFNFYGWFLKVRKDTDAESFSKIIVSQYARKYPYPRKYISLSAVRLDMLGFVKDNLDDFTDQLKSNQNLDFKALASARKSALNYTTLSNQSDRSSLDLLDYAKKASTAAPITQNYFEKLKTSVEDSIIFNYHSYDMPTSTGLAIYTPSPLAISAHYKYIRFAYDSGWDEWLTTQTL